MRPGAVLWRAGLPALGCEAPLKSASSLCQAERSHRFYDCCAAERGQARSPQDRARLEVVVSHGYPSDQRRDIQPGRTRQQRTPLRRGIQLQLIDGFAPQRLVELLAVGAAGVMRLRVIPQVRLED